MSIENVICIHPPLSEEGFWRVSGHRHRDKLVPTERLAVSIAVERARRIESAGKTPFIKVPGRDGAWETFPV